MNSEERKITSKNYEEYIKSRFNTLSQIELIEIVKKSVNNEILEDIITKQDIYTKIVDELGVPSPTVRRVARDLRTELLQKIQILQSDMPKVLIYESSEEKSLSSSNLVNLESQMPKKESKSMIIGTESNEFIQNKMTFEKLKPQLLKDPSYVGKYVAIVKNNICESGADDAKLAKQVYDQHGYVPMYIGLVSMKSKKTKIPSVLGVK